MGSQKSPRACLVDMRSKQTEVEADGIVDVTNEFAVDDVDFFSPSPDPLPMPDVRATLLADERPDLLDEPALATAERPEAPSNAERRRPVRSRQALEDFEPERPSRARDDGEASEVQVPRVTPLESTLRHEPLPAEAAPTGRSLRLLDRVPRIVWIALGVVGVVMVMAATNLPSHVARAVGVGGGRTQTWTVPAAANRSSGAGRVAKLRAPTRRLRVPRSLPAAATPKVTPRKHRKVRHHRIHRAASPTSNSQPAAPVVPTYHAPTAPRVVVPTYHAPKRSAAAREFGL